VAVCFGRLIPLARPFGPFIAGASHFSYRRFLPWNLLGTLLFTLLFCGLGYAFYRSYDEVAAALGRGALGVLLAIVAAGVAVYVVRQRRRAAREAAP
jgi:membrane protein DedA with SNARE-associated domain